MRHSAPRLARPLLLGLRYLTLSVVAVVLISLLLPSAPSAGDRSAANLTTWATTADPPAPVAGDAEVRAALLNYRCSVGDTEIAAASRSAVVIVGGRVEHVDFDRGWKIYTGAEPGTFVALCRSTV